MRWRHIRRVVSSGLFVAAVPLLSGCVVGALPRVPVRPPPGLVFTNVQAPLTTDFDNTPIGSKEGRASAFYFREPFFGTTWAWGDASIETAAKERNISETHYADYSMTQVLGIVGILEVRVRGE